MFVWALAHSDIEGD